MYICIRMRFISVIIIMLHTCVKITARVSEGNPNDGITIVCMPNIAVYMIYGAAIQNDGQSFLTIS